MVGEIRFLPFEEAGWVQSHTDVWKKWGRWRYKAGHAPQVWKANGCRSRWSTDGGFAPQPAQGQTGGGLCHSAWEGLYSSSLRSTHQTMPFGHALSSRSKARPPWQTPQARQSQSGYQTLRLGAAQQLTWWLFSCPQLTAGSPVSQLCASTHHQLPLRHIPQDGHRGLKVLSACKHPTATPQHSWPWNNPFEPSARDCGTKRSSATLAHLFRSSSCGAPSAKPAKTTQDPGEY